MRAFRINFNLEEPFPDGKNIGNVGEKNASRLIITPPAEMAENEEITSYIAAFATVKGAVRLGPFEKKEELTIPVISSLTVGYSLAFQLEGYDGAGKMIVKSPLLSGITFGAAVSGCGIYSPEDETPSGLIGAHTHENMQVLNGLSEANGVLVYNGSAIGAKKTKTVELTVSEGEAEAYVGHTLSNSVHFIAFDGIAPGAEIISVEIKANVNGYEDKWVDLRDMILAYPYFPYLVSMHRSFFMEDYDGVCVAVVYFIEDMTNDFYSSIMSSGITAMRVTYADESGVG